MKVLKIITVFLFVVSCSNNDDDLITDPTLADYLSNKKIEAGGVVACSASGVEENSIFTFYYPKAGASNIKFFETESIDLEKLEYSNYKQKTLESEPVFNGYLGRFTSTASNEKWIIITFELDDEIKVSNPIHSKHISKPTVTNDLVTVNQDIALMPKFTWQANAFGDNAIYFQVLSTSDDDLISGTYTIENNFQFYNTDNVVFNITPETQLPLKNNTPYNFTLMDVSEDNWVNLISKTSFITQ